MHPVQAYLDTLKPGQSRHQAARSLRRIQTIALDLADSPDGFIWARLDGVRFDELRSRLVGQYAPATVRHMLSCVRGVLRAAAELEDRDQDSAAAGLPGKAVAVRTAGLPGRARDPSPARAFLATLSAGPSRDSAVSALRRLIQVAGLLSGRHYGTIDEFPWAALRAAETLALRSELAQRYAPATANRMLSCLRGVLRASWRLGLIEGDDYRRAIDIPSVRGARLPAGRAVGSREMSRLFLSCRQGGSAPLGARDAAALALLYAGGLRRAEACALRIRDVDLRTGEIRLIGKGNRERRIWLAGGALAALRDWIRWRGTEPGPLLTRVHRGGRIAHGRGISGDALIRRLTQRCLEAGIKRMTPHDLRRTFVSNALDAGVDIAVVQRLAGHASPVTTSRYDRRGETVLRQAAVQIHTPYDEPGRRLETDPEPPAG